MIEACQATCYLLYTNPHPYHGLLNISQIEEFFLPLAVWKVTKNNNLSLFWPCTLSMGPGKECDCWPSSALLQESIITVWLPCKQAPTEIKLRLRILL